MYLPNSENALNFQYFASSFRQIILHLVTFATFWLLFSFLPVNQSQDH